MGILDKEKQKTEVKPLIREDEYKPIRGEELEKVLAGDTPPGYIKIATPPPKPATKWVRAFTFITSNWDLVTLAILGICIFALGYFSRCLQEGLTADQIKVGLGTFVEIIIAVFGTSIALFIKLLCSKGTVADSFTNSFKSFQAELTTRKGKIKAGSITPWGYSQQPKKQ
jgi:hypothetical protein